MSMNIAGVTAAIVVVSDPEAHLRLWRDTIGFVEVSRGRIDPVTARALYGIGRSIDVWCLAAPGTSSGMLHLLQLPHVVRHAVAAGPSMLTTGPHSLDVYVRSFDEAEQVLAKGGWSFRGKPRSVCVQLDGKSTTVTEAALLAPPEGVHVQFLRPDAPKRTQVWARSPEAMFTELTSSLVTAVNVDAEHEFWLALGMKKWYDLNVQDENMCYWLGVPTGTHVRITGMAGTTNSDVEIIGLPEGMAIETPTRPIGHSLGIAGYSVRTDNLDAALAALRSPGLPEIKVAKVVQVNTPQHRSARIAHVQTPNRVAVELWQPV
jgi:hypothetical protein